MKRYLILSHILFAIAIGFLGYQVFQFKDNFGATIPTVVALYEDSLQSAISATATSMTLVRGTDKESSNLSGTIGFVVDEGTSSEEFIRCTASGTALTSCLRGISVTNPATETASLQKTHRRGASVKITTYPQLAILSRILNGTDTIPNRIAYATHPSFTGTAASTSLATKKYVDDTNNTGAADATTTLQGLVEMSTFSEIASGTTYGATGAFLTFTSKDLINSKHSNHFFNGATGDSDSYALTISGVASLSTGMEFTFIASDSNSGAATLNVNSLGAITILRQDGSALSDFDIGKTSAQKVVYNNGQYRLLTREQAPAGTIAMYASVSAPNGWLLADGSAVSRTTYSKLFSLVSTQYGVGDGSTTFNIPNFKSRNAFGLNVASGSNDTLGETGGYASASMTIAQMPAHTHTIQDGSAGGGGGIEVNLNQDGGADATSDSTGGGAKFPVMDPYITVNFIIKY